MKKLFLITLILAFSSSSFLIYAQNDYSKGHFSVINEYGPFFGRGTIGFTGVFIAGYTLPNQKEMFGLGVGYEAGEEIGQGLPLFLNFRHIFYPEKSFTPIVNVAMGLRYSVPNSQERNQNFGYYVTVSSGFHAKLFSFSGGLFFKSYGITGFYTGLEIKCGYKL